MKEFINLRGASLTPIHLGSVLLSKQEDPCSTSYVEPAVNRQPGFRRELVEQITSWLVEWKCSSLTKSNTETIAKLARLGPAENDEPMQKNVELSRFHSMKCIKT